MSNTNFLTAERLRELLHYDPETGLFTWAVERRRKVQAGAIAGTLNKVGYRVIRIDYRLYLAHRLAWLYSYGDWPRGVIDHVNGEHADNRLCNLRDVDDTINAQNVIKPRAHSRSGVLGAHLHIRADGLPSWRAAVRVDGKTVHLGSFQTPEQAHEAYLSAKRELHDGCTL